MIWLNTTNVQCKWQRIYVTNGNYRYKIWQQRNAFKVAVLFLRDKIYSHLRQIRPDRQDVIALDYCAMHVWSNKLKCSDFFCISMWTTYQLRLSKYLTKSVQSLYYSILAHLNALVRTHLVLLLCNSHVILQIEVNKTSSMHSCGRHINSDLGYVICSSYDTTLLSHGQSEYNPELLLVVHYSWQR